MNNRYGIYISLWKIQSNIIVLTNAIFEILQTNRKQSYWNLHIKLNLSKLNFYNLQALKSKDWLRFGQLMDENFATRRKMYGDETLGRKNLQMVDICQKYGAHCKFPGNFKLDFPIDCFFFGPT